VRPPLLISHADTQPRPRLDAVQPAELIQVASLYPLLNAAEALFRNCCTTR
jgi:hypothetical protein